MKKIFFILIILCFSCNENKEDSKTSIHSHIDNVITGNVRIEIFNKEKPSIFIDAGVLHQYKDSTLLFDGVIAELYNDNGEKASEVHSDTAIVYNRSDSIKAIGNVEIKSVKGHKLETKREIILYNDLKLVKSDNDVAFTSNKDDWLYGKGFLSNFDMTNIEIFKPKGELGR